MMSDWNWFDKAIAQMRYGVIKQFIPKGGVAADIGCGQDAAFLKYCSQFIVQGYGFDFKIKNSKINNLKLRNNAESERLELNDECCDCVFMIAVLEHLERPESMLEEIHRALKKDGKVVITTPTKAAKRVLEFMAFQLHVINEDEIREHKHYYNKKEIVELFEKCGFSDCMYKKFMLGMNSRVIAVKHCT